MSNNSSYYFTTTTPTIYNGTGGPINICNTKERNCNNYSKLL